MPSLVDEILERLRRVSRPSQPYRPRKMPKSAPNGKIDLGDDLLPFTRFAKVTDSSPIVLRQMIARGALKTHFLPGSSLARYSTKELADFINAYYS